LRKLDHFDFTPEEPLNLKTLLFFGERTEKMIKVKVGPEERDLSQIKPDWIMQQLNRQRKDGAVCVRVTIKDGSRNMTLGTGACAGGGGTWNPNAEENKVWELWKKHRLTQADFPPGQLISFLNEIG
jgi:hypothetical protein